MIETIIEKMTSRDVFMILCGCVLMAGFRLIIIGLVRLGFMIRGWAYRKVRRVRKPTAYYSFDQKPADDYAEYCKAYEEGRYYPDPRD